MCHWHHMIVKKYFSSKIRTGILIWMLLNLCLVLEVLISLCQSRWLAKGQNYVQPPRHTQEISR